MAYSQIQYEVEGRVLTITLNRPEKLNAFTTTMMNELLDALDRADADDDVRATILTGAGRAFCAGADITSGTDAFYRERKSEPPSIDTCIAAPTTGNGRTQTSVRPDSSETYASQRPSGEKTGQPTL